MKVLTPQQRWAVESDRHTVVTASAGSGKTTVLVQRYLRLVVEHEVDPQRIVAITFTRKAAAEMYARIAAELERLLAAAQQPQELRKFMFLRERLTGAPISTIHSFCAQLLRRFPLEVGVLPSFAELNELEALRLRREVALQTLEELWSDPEWSRLLWELLRQFGRSELEELLQAAVEQSERLVLLQPVLERPWLERLRALRTEFCAGAWGDAAPESARACPRGARCRAFGQAGTGAPRGGRAAHCPPARSAPAARAFGHLGSARAVAAIARAAVLQRW
jgi:ATP-dependent exoDNAse (exonuclease V) beta subunit